jgi:uncharacterized membrane protein YkgB
MTHSSGARLARVQVVAQPQIDPVRSIGLPRIQWLPYQAELGSGDTARVPERTANALLEWYRPLEQRLVDWMAANGIAFLRVSLAIVFLWFGALKFVPGTSPAEHLAGETMARLTLGMLSPRAALILLAVWETAVGVALVLGVHLRLALGLLLLQMAGTLTPLVLFPAETFVHFPYAPTLEGQYILKNLVLVSAAIVIGATLRGGRLIAGPDAACCCGESRCRQGPWLPKSTWGAR